MVVIMMEKQLPVDGGTGGEASDSVDAGGTGQGGEGSTYAGASAGTLLVQR